MRITCVIGTRPEAIKLSPVIHAVRRADSPLHATIVSSGQHPAEVAAILDELDLRPDETLADCAGLALTDMTAALVGNLGRCRAIADAGVVLVQGDTSTAFAGALAAFHRRVPVAHLEAGLRSGIPDAPFPEEAHRTLIATLASVHLAPTEQARRNLRAMGIEAWRIAVTGNTCVDALIARGTPAHTIPEIEHGRRLVLVTLHRRESWGGVLADVCDAIADVARSRDDATVVFPLHPNPGVQAVVTERLSGVPHVQLLQPLPYRQFISYLHAAHVVVTDSGGVQEEAATLGRPTLVVRAVTDRPEAVDVGIARLVGTDPVVVATALRQALLNTPADGVRDIYGDGRAAERVVAALTRWRRGLRPLLPPELEFRSTSTDYASALG